MWLIPSDKEIEGSQHVLHLTSIVKEMADTVVPQMLNKREQLFSTEKGNLESDLSYHKDALAALEQKLGGKEISVALTKVCVLVTFVRLSSSLP